MKTDKRFKMKTLEGQFESGGLFVVDSFTGFLGFLHENLFPLNA
jgi:hypothetical protein